MSGFIEQRIITAVRGLLTGRVNELLGTIEYAIPLVELGDYGGNSIVTPAVTLASCERSEKERVVKLDAYSVTITLTLPETPESELHCYAYAWAVCRAVEENPALGGVAERAEVTGKKYIKPKKLNCGVGWEVVISLRVTVESQVTENR